MHLCRNVLIVHTSQLPVVKTNSIKYVGLIFDQDIIWKKNVDDLKLKLNNILQQYNTMTDK